MTNFYLFILFTNRFNELSSDEKCRVSKDSVSKLADKIENELSKLFKNTVQQKYGVKARSLMFNLRDPKNHLFKKVMMGKISPQRLVAMSTDELANSELKNWREKEKRNTIDLIKREQEDKLSQVIVKKTHKGEEFITENDLISEVPTGEAIMANGMCGFKSI